MKSKLEIKLCNRCKSKVYSDDLYEYVDYVDSVIIHKYCRVCFCYIVGCTNPKLCKGLDSCKKCKNKCRYVVRRLTKEIMSDLKSVIN